MSRPQKIHPPLPFSFNEVLTSIALGNGVEGTLVEKLPENPPTESAKRKKKKSKSK
jgi:hypothetical protein